MIRPSNARYLHDVSVSLKDLAGWFVAVVVTPEIVRERAETMALTTDMTKDTPPTTITTLAMILELAWD